MFSSLIFTMWFGFGQTFAKNYGTYESGVAVKPTSVASCPAHIYNATSFAPIQFDTTTLAPDTTGVTILCCNDELSWTMS